MIPPHDWEKYYISGYLIIWVVIGDDDYDNRTEIMGWSHTKDFY